MAFLKSRASTRLVILATALLISSSATIVRAHAGDGDPNAVHACVHKKNGRVRFVAADPSAGCRPNENPLHLAIQGERGPSGTPGPPGHEGRSALTALRPGETVSGVWGAGVPLGLTGGVYSAFATFPIPLEVAIPDGHQVYVPTAPAPNCPGPGQAAPGFLCVYQGILVNTGTPVDGSIFNPETPSTAGASRFGFGIIMQGGQVFGEAGGTFTVTAP